MEEDQGIKPAEPRRLGSEDARRPAGVRAVRLLHRAVQLQQRRMGRRARRHLRPQGTHDL